LHYEADIQLRENHVRVHVTGRRRTGDAAFEAGQVGRHIVEFCRKADVFRVLVILDLSGRLSAIDSYEIVSQATEYGWDHNFKLAFVAIDSESADDVKFTETIAVNRAYSVRQFTDKAEAAEWLLKD
jgi:hypothetical protein